MVEHESRKLLFVITKSNFGGAQRYVYDLATHCNNHGFSVEVAVGGEGELVRKLREKGIPVHTTPHLQRDVNLFKEVAACRTLWKLIGQIQPDVIHLNSTKASFIGALAARLQGTRNIVFTAHGWPFREPRTWWWKSLAWTASYATALLCHHVITVSRHDATHTRMPLIRNRITHIHTAIDTTATFQNRLEARTALCGAADQKEHIDDLWVGSIAELHHNKNLLSALHSIAAFNAGSTRNIFYIVIGEGEEREVLENYVQDHNLSQQVRLLGYRENARTYLKAFDVFLLPSKKEGLPYALLEAGVAGVPCIASDVGGIPEVIENQITGLLIDPHDTQTIVDALHIVSHDEAARREMGATLQKKVQTQFTLEAMIEETIRVYRN